MVLAPDKVKIEKWKAENAELAKAAEEVSEIEEDLNDVEEDEATDSEWNHNFGPEAFGPDIGLDSVRGLSAVQADARRPRFRTISVTWPRNQHSLSRCLSLHLG